MKEITPEMVKELRERSGVGMAKCKEALVLAEGNMEKAIDVLRKAGLAASVKKEGREAKGERSARSEVLTCRPSYQPAQEPEGLSRLRNSRNPNR